MKQMVYRLTGDSNDEELTPEHFVQINDEVDSLSSEDPSTKLFWSNDVKHEAEWQHDLGLIFPAAHRFDVELPAAVIITKANIAGEFAWFALCYGHGNTLLNQDKIFRRWGLKVALNLICANPGTREILRRIDSRVIRANSMKIAQQISRPDSIDSFGVNPQTDILRAIAGKPVDDDWGSTVYGQDGVSVKIEGNLSQIHEVLGNLETIYNKRDYLQRFDWIDHFYPVRDSLLRTALFSELIEKLRAKNVDNLTLTSPDLTDWGNSVFKIKGVYAKESSSEITLLDYLNEFELRNSLDELNIEKLKQHRLVNETNGDTWPIFRCIEGEIDYNQKTYYFIEGQFYEIDPTFLAEVKEYLRMKIHQSERMLPNINPGLSEGDYICSVAEGENDLLVMDKELISGFPSPNSKIELCDLLSNNHEFIHIKKGVQSTTLSHLFNQAANSIQLFWKDSQFRNAAIQKVASIELENHCQPIWSNSLSENIPNNLNMHLILAVTANWNGQDFIERIPFFSCISLRSAIQSLDGFNINIEYIQIDES